MGQPPQARLNSADDDRNIFVRLANQIAVDNCGIVGPFSKNASRRKGIVVPSFFRHGIMIDHGIHIPSADDKSKSRFSININTFFVFPVGLGYDPYPVIICFQNPADNGVTKGGVVHIGIPDNIDKIHAVPSSGFHILSAYRQKVFNHNSSS